MKLELTDVHAGYGRVEVLKGISLEVSRGEVVCLVGANGAGKSTLLKAISGLLALRGGSIFFAGVDIAKARPDDIVRAGISHVPEGRQIFTTLTVHQNLFLGAYVHRKSKGELEEMYKNVLGLFPILKQRFERKAATLSGGEQQMLAIARGLMSEPKLLLLDEPSLGLAPLVVDSIFGIVKNLRASGIPILLVEQNVAAALTIADRAYIMETGKIVTHGSAAQLRGDDEVRRRYLGM